MGPRSRLSTRDRPTGCEEETICAGRSAATHRRRRCSGLSELLAVSLDKARRQRAERLCAHAGHDVGGEVVDLVAIWASRSAGSISTVGIFLRLGRKSVVSGKRGSRVSRGGRRTLKKTKKII